MAGETEVERMVARLVGDTSQFTASFEQASKTAETTANDIGRATDQISAKTIAAGQLIAKGIEWVANKLKGFGHQALDGFAEAELGELKLRTALEANGRAVESTMADYKAYANDLQRITTAEDDHVLTLFKTAEQFETTGSAAKRAVHDAIALAAANDSSADSMIRITSAMAKGDIETAMRFGRMIPQLRGVRDEAAFTAKYALLVKSGFAQAEAETKTFTGTMKQMKVAFGNALEIVGQVVAEAIQPLVRWIKEASDWFQTLSPSVTKAISIIGLVTAAVGTLVVAWGPIVSVVSGVGTVIMAALSPMGAVVAAIAAAVYLAVEAMGGWERSWELVKQAAIDFWNYLQPAFLLISSVAQDVFTGILDLARTVFTTIYSVVASIWAKIGVSTLSLFAAIKDYAQTGLLVVGYAFKNIGTIASLTWVSIQLGAVTTANTIEYYFTEVIPAWLKWFADTAWHIFSRLTHNTITLFSNLGKNILEMITKLPDLISGKISATNWAKVWKPVSDGALEVFTDIAKPKIEERQQGKLERQLTKQYQTIASNVLSGYQKYRDEKLADVENKMLDLSKPLEKGIQNPANLAAAAIKRVGKASHDAAQEATEFGSGEHLKRLADYFNALRGDPSTDTPNKNNGAPAIVAQAGKDLDKYGVPILNTSIPENQKYYQGATPETIRQTATSEVAKPMVAKSPEAVVSVNTSGSHTNKTNALLAELVKLADQQLARPPIKVSQANL